MLTPSTTSTNQTGYGVVWPMVTLLATAALTLSLLFLLPSPNGWLVFVACAAIPMVCLAVRYPDLITAFTVFMLFANVPVVAMRFHGVPKVAAAIAPPAALLLVWLYLLVSKKESFVFPRAWPWALGLLAVEVISSMSARFPGLALEMLKGQVIEGLALFLILCNVVRTRACLQKVVIALLVAGSFMGGLSAIQQLTGTHLRNYGGFAQVPMEGRGFTVDQHVQQRRSAGPLGEQNRYAQNMLMLLPLAVLPAFRKTSWTKLGYVAAAFLIAAGCILTFSRGAAVAFVMLTMVMVFAGYIRSRHLLMLGAASLLMLAAFPQLVTRMDTIQTLIGQITGNKAAYAEDVDGAIKGRATSMLAALRVTAEHPLLGVGPGNFPFYNRKYAKVGGFRAQEEDRAAHCLYLHLSSEIGLLGLGLFLAMCGVTLHGLHQVRRTHLESDPELANLGAMFAMAILAYLLCGIFLHYSFIRFFWLIFALASCVPLIATREAKQAQAASGVTA